jgi:hypothetical protein
VRHVHGAKGKCAGSRPRPATGGGVRRGRAAPSRGEDLTDGWSIHLEIDRLGHNRRDLVGIVGIVGIVGARQVGVKSLTIGIVDAITTRGTLVFGMFVLLAE